MADQPPVPANAGEETRTRLPGPSAPDAGTPQAAGGTPRWVKAFGIIGLLLVLLIIVMLLTGHGPGRHMHTGLGTHLAPAGVADGRGTALDGSPA